MATQIIRPKDREEWLKYRESGIGSSEVATILGLNPWETPYQLWRRKVGIDAPKEETFAMKAGHYLEDAVALFWHDETGCEIIKRSAIDWLVVNPEKPYMRVSPDRTFWLKDKRHSEKNKGILECKTTQMKVDADDIPIHWFCQVQYQLGVSELTEGSLAWLCSGREFGYKDIQFNPDFFHTIETEVEKFWTINVLGNEEPEAIRAEDVIAKYRTHADGKVVEVGDDIYIAYEALTEIREAIAEMEERKAGFEDKLKLSFGDAEAITHNGQTLATWKSAKPSKKFDTKVFKSEHPDLYEAYCKESQGSRRFLVK